MPVTRKRKIEVARLAGFGLVLAGLFALFLAVVGAQNAGAVKPSPRVSTLHCQQSTDNSLGQAVQYGACETTTTTDTEASTTYLTTTTKHRCGCSTTTTEYVTSTTQQCGCSTTSTEATTTTLDTLPSSSTMPETSTSVSDSLPVSSSTGAAEETTTTGEGGLGTIVPITTGHSGESPQGGSSPVSQAEAVNGQLPFTGSSTLALAGFGLLLVATGLALSLRRRRLAR
jgi:LPXTG-motif cell wall-anchored protein